MGSIEKEREILENLCNRIKEEGISTCAATVSPDNVFSIFGVVRKEVPYCRVLLHLIQNHWQSFEEDVLGGCCGGQSLDRFENEFACEAPCPMYEKEGRIDIFLETKNHVIAIEVKIDAEDQEHQLVRYQKELNRIYPSKEKYIFYLTKDGKPASENSLCCNKNNECNIRNEDCKIAENGYRRISFQKEIYDWVKNIAVTEKGNDIAVQFLEVLELENTTVEKQVLLLKESKEKLDVVRALSGALPILWEEIQKTFLDVLSEKMIEKYEFSQEEKGSKTYKSEIWAVTLTKENQELHFCYEKNFFLRTGKGDEQWEYIAKSAFGKNPKGQICTTRSKEAFCFKSFDSSNDGLVEWFYNRDPEIINRIAKGVNCFFKKQTAK